MSRIEDLSLDRDGFRLEAFEATWDTAVFGHPVAQVRSLQLPDRNPGPEEMHAFRDWLDRHGFRMASCRLPHDRLRQSMWLEAFGFRFMEFVLHPQLEGLQAYPTAETGLQVLAAEQADMEELKCIAEEAFGHERYHIDPRLDRRLADIRYGRWVMNSLGHPRQRLVRIAEEGNTIGFFIYEKMEDLSAYWHLTAIAPRWQGKGYGKRAWLTMLGHNKAEGCPSIATTISARNTAVMNLYARLGFRFAPPDMTFHWVRE